MSVQGSAHQQETACMCTRTLNIISNKCNIFAIYFNSYSKFSI